MVILTKDEVDFREKKISVDKEGDYIMIKVSVHQEDNSNL